MRGHTLTCDCQTRCLHEGILLISYSVTAKPGVWMRGQALFCDYQTRYLNAGTGLVPWLPNKVYKWGDRPCSVTAKQGVWIWSQWVRIQRVRPWVHWLKVEPVTWSTDSTGILPSVGAWPETHKGMLWRSIIIYDIICIHILLSMNDSNSSTNQTLALKRIIHYIILHQCYLHWQCSFYKLKSISKSHAIINEDSGEYADSICVSMPLC